MAGLVNEKVWDSIKILNKMIEDCDTGEPVYFCQLEEIKKYFTDCKTILKRALLMSNKELFNEVELDEIKARMLLVENRIKTISSKIL